VKNSSDSISVDFLKTTYGRDNNGKYDQYSFISKNENNDHNHSVKIRIYDTKKLNSKTAKIHVNCDCNDFKYRWSYVLNKKGSANLGKTKNLPPNETNPDKIAGACKHIYAAMKWIKNKRDL